MFLIFTFPWTNNKCTKDAQQFYNTDIAQKLMKKRLEMNEIGGNVLLMDKKWIATF